MVVEASELKSKNESNEAKPASNDAATDELSEEDKQLMETLDMLISRLEDADQSLHRPALEALCVQIKSSAVSLTSVPKALKFLRNKYSQLCSIYEQFSNSKDKSFLADILSIIAMTNSGGGSETTEKDTANDAATAARPGPYSHDTLKYRLLGQGGDIGEWGHEYVRHLAMELIDVYDEGASDCDRLAALAMEVANFSLEHNGEPDACDLLFEIGKLDALVDLCFSKEGRDHSRVCLYLLSCVPYEADGDDKKALRVAHQIYRRAGDLCQSIVLAVRLGDAKTILEDFRACKDPITFKQMAFILARHRCAIDHKILLQDVAHDAKLTAQLETILSNGGLSENFKMLARELEIVDAKTPEDIYKSHLQDSLRVTTAPTPRQNLAAAFVNAFVNAGFGNDKLVSGAEVEADETKSWIYKVKDHGVISTVASLGMLHLWDAEAGLTSLDRYLYSENVNIKAGAVLGIGLVHTGTKNESDPALALLREYLETSDGNQNPLLLEVALMGLGLAYGGSGRDDVIEPIVPLISHESITVSSMAALACAHIFVGSGNGDLASTILQTMMERDAKQLDQPTAKFLALALALLYLNRAESEAEVIVDTLQVIEHPIAKDAMVLVKVCSYAGSGNVLKIQELLRICQTTSTTPAADAENADGGSTLESEAYAVLGVALICMVEDIGKEMSHRLFSHLMHYGSQTVRKAVPLALGLLYVSHPAPNVIDLLSKFSHDAEKSVAVAAIFSLGLVSAGTNNAKVAQLLRQLAAYYQRDADCLYVVRLAQGLTHAAKGTVSLSPVHSHRLLLSPVAVAGLLTVVTSILDAQQLLLNRSSYLLYYLVEAMYPRFMATLDGDDLKPKAIQVRVGQAVDVVGQAGKPKTITGFQTHTSPILLAYGERAELATDEFLSVSPILENFVIIKKNPDHVG